MKNGLKVAVIGGGSSYTPELVEGLIRRYEEFPVSDVYLVDIPSGQEKLAIVGALAQRMVEAANCPMRVHLTLDRREAIRGADFVTTQIRVGQIPARAIDERIPLKYQCIGQETTGAGGFAKALRTIPVILDICKDMEELSPQGFLLNFTNPAGMVTEAVLKYSHIRSIGLCNLPISTQMQIARWKNVDATDVDMEWVGINHLNWATQIRVRGEDVLPQILSQTDSSGTPSAVNIPDLQWDPLLLQSIGALPCSYLRYYYMTDEMLQEQLVALKHGGTRADAVRAIERDLFEKYKDKSLRTKPTELEQRGGAYYSLAAVNLMSSIYNHRKDIQQVNVRNNGILPFLPMDASIETSCVIDQNGAHPLAIESHIAPHMRGLLQVVKSYEALAIEAAVHGDYLSALRALTIHPLVTSFQVAKLIMSDILAQHKDYLPLFSS